MVNRVAVTIDSADIFGNQFKTGRIRLVPSQRVSDTVNHMLLEMTEATVWFDRTSKPVVNLYPNDLLGPQNDDATPGWSYRVYYDDCPGNPQPWSFNLLSTDGPDQNLSDLAVASPQAGVGGGGGAVTKFNMPAVLRSDFKFAPEDYPNGEGDVIIVSDASITAGSNILSFASTQPLTTTAIEGGKFVYIFGAGPSGGDYYGHTIVSVTDHSTAVLSANASTTVSNHGCMFGTNTSPAIKAAIADSWTFMAGSRREAALCLFGNGYGAADVPVLGGSTAGNAMFPMAPRGVTSRKWRNVIVTNSDASSLPHWLQTDPQEDGSGIVVLIGGGTIDSTYGPPSVFGGPYAGYGGGTSLFSNMHTRVDGVGIMAPRDCGFTGFDWLGMAEISMLNWGYLAAATVPAGTAWPVLGNYGSLTRTACGCRMPDTNNNAIAEMGRWSVEGLPYATMPSEHATCVEGTAVNCFVAIRPYSGTAMAHSFDLSKIKTENCSYSVSPMPSGVTGFVGGNVVKGDISGIDYESVTDVLHDPGNLMEGSITAGGNYDSTTNNGYGNVPVTGGAGVRVYDRLRIRGPVSSVHTPPASGGTWTNLYGGEAEVTLAISGGTLSALTINGVTQLIPASCVFYRFKLVPGDVFVPTFSGSLAGMSVTVS